MLELSRESDWEAVRRLSVQIHDLHAAWRPDMFYHCDEPYPQAAFHEDIRNRMVYVAKIQKLVIGYVVLSVLEKGGPGIVPVRQMQIKSICVEEMLRGRGIGREIIADVRALASAFGCREVTLGVLPENDIAVGFYQKCGFMIRKIDMQMKL